MKWYAERDGEMKGSKEYLFVDGYNVLHSWEIFQDDLHEHFEEARDKLIDIMIEYKHYTKIHVILVFDGHLVKGGNGSEMTKDGVRIIFTKERETADNYIERQIDELGKNKRVRVATSDWLEQQIVLGKGATRISARELESEIEFQRRLVKRNMNRLKMESKHSMGRLNEKNMAALKNLLEK